jgi:hypothetical protein
MLDLMTTQRRATQSRLAISLLTLCLFAASCSNAVDTTEIAKTEASSKTDASPVAANQSPSTATAGAVSDSEYDKNYAAYNEALICAVKLSVLSVVAMKAEDAALAGDFEQHAQRHLELVQQFAAKLKFSEAQTQEARQSLSKQEDRASNISEQAIAKTVQFCAPELMAKLQ